jgi:hypothetical protein
MATKCATPIRPRNTNKPSLSFIMARASIIVALTNPRVVRSLYARATGYECDAVKIFCNKDGVVTKVKYREHLAPDTTACIFWFKNRRKDLWRDRHDAEQPIIDNPNQTIRELRDELLHDMADAGLVRLLPPAKPATRR